MKHTTQTATVKEMRALANTAKKHSEDAANSWQQVHSLTAAAHSTANRRTHPAADPFLNHTMKTKLDTEIALIQHEDIRLLVRTVLDAAPACFWSMPAATTGKCHPAISLGEGGLVRHTRAVVRIACHLLDMQGIYPEERQYSIALAACILHDCCKKWDTEKYTAFAHPRRAAELIATQANILWPADMADLPPATAGELLEHPERAYASTASAVRCIIAAVESHMGRWNFTPRTGEELPRPLTPMQRLVHTADFLASRKDITLADIA